MKEGRPTLKPCPSTTAAPVLVVYRRVRELDEETIMLGPGKFGTWVFLHCFPEVQIKKGSIWLYMTTRQHYLVTTKYFLSHKQRCV